MSRLTGWLIRYLIGLLVVAVLSSGFLPAAVGDPLDSGDRGTRAVEKSVKVKPIVGINDMVVESSADRVLQDSWPDSGKYDLKSKPEWQGREHFIYEGEVVWFDEPGNMLYGYVGKALGFSDDTLRAAGGVIQITERKSKWSYVSSHFDDPRDQKAINKGIQRFKDKHSRFWW